MPRTCHMTFSTERRVILLIFLAIHFLQTTQQNISSCSSLPSSNDSLSCINGVCFNQSCYCDVGFIGEDCSINITDCQVNDSLTCINGIYCNQSCYCPKGFILQNCSFETEECLENNTCLCDKENGTSNISTCVEIAQCLTSNHSCIESQNEICVNTNASYRCVCKERGCISSTNETSLSLSSSSSSSSSIRTTIAQMTNVVPYRKTFSFRAILKNNTFDLDFQIDLKILESNYYKEMSKMVSTLIQDVIDLNLGNTTNSSISNIFFYEGSVIVTADVTISFISSFKDEEFVNMFLSAKQNGLSLGDVLIIDQNNYCLLMGYLVCDKMATCHYASGNYSCICNEGYKDVDAIDQPGTHCHAVYNNYLGIGFAIAAGCVVLIVLAVAFAVRIHSHHHLAYNFQVSQRYANDAFTEQEERGGRQLQPSLAQLENPEPTDQISTERKTYV